MTTLLSNFELYRRNARRGMAEILRHARPRRVRPLLQFAEAELRMPTGRFRGQPFRREYQPATAVLMEMLSDDHWLESWIVGPHQAGKSFAIVAFGLWTLFERREDVILGLPDIGMRTVKWKKDFLPLIESSRYRSQLPKTGRGSKGGISEIVQFQNGTSLICMGAGGGDTQRAGATARTLIITEAEKFGVRSAGSDEGNKFEQIRGRVAHFAGTERVVAESTITIQEALMWSSYVGGTASVVRVQCHSCGAYVAPEREHLIGWQAARTEQEARETGAFSCPSCGIVWSESQRLRNLQTAIVTHSGQTVTSDGQVIGDNPPTRKLGFRFSAATNAFADAGSIAVEEWTRERSTNPSLRDSADRALNQFRFAVPAKPQRYEVDPLDGRLLMSRTTAPGFMTVFETTAILTGGIDVRKTQLHWCVVEWPEAAGPRIVAWGVEAIDQTMLWETAFAEAAGRIQQRFRDGFPTADGTSWIPVSFSLMDAGWQTWSVQEVTDSDDFMMPCKGFGAGILRSQQYRSPRSVGTNCKLIGQDFHVAYLADRWLVELDASKWKSRLHQMLRMNVSDPHALTFCQADPSMLRNLVMHLTSEKQIEKYEGGELLVTWSDPVGENHFLDATSLAVAARHIEDALRQSLIEQQPDTEVWQPTVYGASGGIFGN